jgi:hypothetical protein
MKLFFNICFIAIIGISIFILKKIILFLIAKEIEEDQDED